MENTGRRRFLGICLGALAAAFAAATAWPVFRYLSPRLAKRSAERVTIPAQEVREGEAKFFEYAGSSAVLVRKQGGGLVALSAVCTHLGCIVQWCSGRRISRHSSAPATAGTTTLTGP
jgi:cytochrome b6-f complex iron-sulfur subunit